VARIIKLYEEKIYIRVSHIRDILREVQTKIWTSAGRNMESEDWMKEP